MKTGFYRPHPKDGEGNVFSLSTPGGGGVPISHNALQHFPECHGAAGGVPCQVQLGGRGGTLPGGYPGGGYPAGGVPWWGVPCQGVPWRGGVPS